VFSKKHFQFPFDTAFFNAHNIQWKTKTRAKGSKGTIVFEFQWLPISGQNNLKWHFLYQNQ
jgi:hypothetical protein